MSQTTPPPRAVRALPVWDTVAASYRSVFRDHLARLPRAAFLPFLISLVLIYLQSLLVMPATVEGAEQVYGPAAIGSVVLGVLGVIPYVIFAVAWHRLMLLGPGIATPSLVPPWRRRHWAFLGYTIAVFLIAYAVVLALGLFSTPLFLLFGQGGGEATPSALFTLPFLVLGALIALAFALVIMRLSFVFPAAALEERYGLGNSWTQTRGQGFRLLAVVILGELPFLVINVVLSFAFAGMSGFGLETPTEAAVGQMSSGAFLIAMLVNFVVSYLSMAVGVSLISISFLTCSGWIPPSTPQSGSMAQVSSSNGEAGPGGQNP